MSNSSSFRDVKKKNLNSEQDDSTLDNKQTALSTPISTARSPCSFNMNNRGTYFAPDQESEPDRSNPLWKVSPRTQKSEEEKLEELIKQESESKPSVWEEIMQEYENERTLLVELNKEKKGFEPELPIGLKLTAAQYLEHYIFPVLCPALEDTLLQAKKEECLQIQKCIFNGLDHISELLWNRNPMHPKRNVRGYKTIFDIPFVKIWLHDHPRPIYPLSWIWTKEEAITVLQSYIRRYFICRDPNCYEMRKFWQIFKQEKREKEFLRDLEHFEEVQEIATDVVNDIIASAVYEAEWKSHGCFCTSKPCHCECKCFRWCKCCQCYRPEKFVAQQFYSNVIIQNSRYSAMSPKL